MAPTSTHAPWEYYRTDAEPGGVLEMVRRRLTAQRAAMIVIRRRHDLGLTRAKRLAEMLARRVQNQFGGTYSWNSNELRFERTGVTGCATVTKDSVQIRVELGLLLRPLRARIDREIRASLDAHLGHDDERAG
jgi:putative polyhydroxyalkanoate system protein